MNVFSNIRVFLVRFYSFFLSNRKSKVIFYHDLHSDIKYTDMSTPLNLFVEHVNIIRNSGYEIVNKINKEKGQIEISFDDGFLGVYDNINVIRDLNIPIQLFVVSSYLGRKNHINKDQLLELSLLSQVTISSHTHNHYRLDSLQENEVLYDLEMSKKVIEGLINEKIASICFPEGIFNLKIINIARKVGFSCLYISIPGFYSDFFLPGVIKRSLVQFASANEFRAILRGGDHILYWWYKYKHYIQS